MLRRRRLCPSVEKRVFLCRRGSNKWERCRTHVTRCELLALHSAWSAELVLALVCAAAACYMRWRVTGGIGITSIRRPSLVIYAPRVPVGQPHLHNSYLITVELVI